MLITLRQLDDIAIYASQPRLRPYVDPLNAAMRAYGIENKLRVAAFIGQVCYESCCFFCPLELTTGTEYEGNAVLGNTEAGDGPRFKGRGLLQLRGRKNYGECGEAMGLDLINHPGLLEDHPHSSNSAAWYWSHKKLNEIADTGDFLHITSELKFLPMVGWGERAMFYFIAKRVLGV